MDELAYSFSLTTFSPTGHLRQIQHALAAVGNGRLTLGINCSNGVVLMTHKVIENPLIDADTVKLVAKVSESCGATYSGLSADYRSLLGYCRREAQDYKEEMGEDAPVNVVAKRVAGIMQDYTQKGGVRPFGCSVLLAGPNGTDEARERLEKRLAEGAEKENREGEEGEEGKEKGKGKEGQETVEDKTAGEAAGEAASAGAAESSGPASPPDPSNSSAKHIPYSLYQVDPSGAYYAWMATAIGKLSAAAKSFLERRYDPTLDVEDGIVLGLSCLLETGDGEVTENTVEVGVIGGVFGDEKFVVLDKETVARYVQTVE